MVKNPVAKALSSGVCHPQVIPPKKGKGKRPTRRADALHLMIRIALTQDAIKEAPAYWAGALSLGEETPKEGTE
jgi:hypothetical protein